MFEKEAEEYAIDNYENCLYDDFPYTNDSRAREQSFKDGAEFGYNKANEWHDLRKDPNDLPIPHCLNWVIALYSNGILWCRARREKCSDGIFWVNSYHNPIYDVIAWKEIVFP